MAVLFTAYVSAAKLDRGSPWRAASSLRSPTGIALAALVLFGLRLWPAVALGAFVANVTSGAAPVDAAFIAVGSTRSRRWSAARSCCVWGSGLRSTASATSSR